MTTPTKNNTKTYGNLLSVGGMLATVGDMKATVDLSKPTPLHWGIEENSLLDQRLGSDKKA